MPVLRHAMLQVASALIPAHKAELVTVSTRSHVNRADPYESAVTGTVNSAMAQVSSMVDRVRVTLLEERVREVTFHDTCTKEKHQAELQLARREHDVSAFNASMQKLAITSSEANSSVTELQAEADRLEVALQEATDSLAEEYSNYTASIQAEEAKQAKLHQAAQALKRFYGNSKTASALLEEDSMRATRNSTDAATSSNSSSAVPTTTRPPRPEGFTSSTAPHAGGGGILGILQLLVEDSERIVASIRRAQQGGSEALSKNAVDTKQAVKDYEQQIVVLQAEKADADMKLEQITAQESAAQVEIGEIKDFLAVIAEKCDWILANFAESQAARQSQVDNLEKAKQAFQGALHESL